MKLKRFEDNIDIWETSSTTLTFHRKNKNNKRLYFLFLGIIFVFIFLFLFIFKIYYYENSTDYLFKKYYYAENVISLTRGDKTLEAVVKFEQKDFDSSTILFKDVLQKDSTNVAVRFYYGISNMEIGNYEETIKSFKYIIEQKNNLYIEYAQWYLGLCYIKMKEKEKAKEIFQKIAAEKDNYYYNKAKEILEKLK